MEQLFLNLGLSEKETEVLIKLIELGPRPVSTIAKHTGHPRSTTYAVLDRLRDLHLVEFFQHRNTKYARAISVDQIIDLYERKQLELEHSVTALSRSREELSKLEKKMSVTPKVRFYEGIPEVERMYEVIMSLPGYSAFFNPKALKESIPKYFYDLPKHYIKTGIKAREIMVACPEAFEYAQIHRSPNYRMRCLPPQHQFEADMLITEERVFLISYGDEQSVGTEIFDPNLARSQLAVFNALWETLDDLE